MKISAQTLEILKNFSRINSRFMVEEPDSVIRTCSNSRDMVAFAKVPETLPKFAIYDLAEFLPIATAFESADFEFGETSVKISSGKSSFRYAYCSEKMIETRPPRNFKVNVADFTIDNLDKATIKTILQAASSLKVDKVCFHTENGSVFAKAAADKNDGNQNTFSVELGTAPEGKTFELFIDVDYFKFISGDYRVRFFGKKMAEFHQVLSSDYDVTYWVSLGTNSTMGG